MFFEKLKEALCWLCWGLAGGEGGGESGGSGADLPQSGPGDGEGRHGSDCVVGVGGGLAGREREVVMSGDDSGSFGGVSAREGCGWPCSVSKSSDGVDGRSPWM